MYVVLLFHLQYVFIDRISITLFGMHKQRFPDTGIPKLPSDFNPPCRPCLLRLMEAALSSIFSGLQFFEYRSGYMYIHHWNIGNGTQNEIVLGAPSSINPQTHAKANMSRKCMQAGDYTSKRDASFRTHCFSCHLPITAMMRGGR